VAHEEGLHYWFRSMGVRIEPVATTFFGAMSKLLFVAMGEPGVGANVGHSLLAPKGKPRTRKHK
jgi:hypothetical protein